MVDRYIKAPKEELDEEDELRIQRTAEEKKNNLEKAVRSTVSLLPSPNDTLSQAFGTYASAGGQKLVYRVKKAGAFGGYKIVEEVCLVIIC